MDSKYSKETLEKLLDLIPEYIFFRSLDGENIYCNKSYAEKFVGCPKEEIYGKKYEDLKILKQFSNVGRAKDQELIENKKSIHYKQSIITNEEKKQNIDVSKYPLFDENKELKGILGIIRDESHKEELDKLREGFFANIKHEFRTPLNMILSNIQLLESKCNSCSKFSCKNCFRSSIQHIYTNSLRLLKLSNNFIDLTNIQTGYFSFTPKNYDIVNFVETVCENINNYKNFNNIDLIFDTDIEELVVNFDHVKIERVLLNIISNAIKFNKEDGTVLVSITSNNNVVTISIKDTGIGIKKERLDSIFETFSDVGDRFTKICEGSGVGLALSKHLVEMHRGNIKVLSEVGKGSEFIVSLPNIYDEDEEVDTAYLKIDNVGIPRVKMELSDIYV